MEREICEKCELDDCYIRVKLEGDGAGVHLYPTEITKACVWKHEDAKLPFRLHVKLFDFTEDKNFGYDIIIHKTGKGIACLDGNEIPWDGLAKFLPDGMYKDECPYEMEHILAVLNKGK